MINLRLDGFSYLVTAHVALVRHVLDDVSQPVIGNNVLKSERFTADRTRPVMDFGQASFAKARSKNQHQHFVTKTFAVVFRLEKPVLAAFRTIGIGHQGLANVAHEFIFNVSLDAAFLAHDCFLFRWLVCNSCVVLSIKLLMFKVRTFKQRCQLYDSIETTSPRPYSDEACKQSRECKLKRGQNAQIISQGNRLLLAAIQRTTWIVLPKRRGKLE